jgi:ribosomal protein S7|uniref:Ribosomal protein S7 n=1 Tax=Entomoneis sp. TaxID=186043 RepID=A0A3G1PWC3_9STRA|nr:ribosomal protein S7 [Entomoneis sp.]
MSRLTRKKIINFIMNKGNKFCSEKLLKKTLKYLIKKNKKESRIVIYLAINQSLPTFKLEVKILKAKKQKLTKTKPSFIFLNKTRVSSSLKLIINLSSSKKNTFFKNLHHQFIDPSSLLIKKITNQAEVLAYKNILTFYRWAV